MVTTTSQYRIRGQEVLLPLPDEFNFGLCLKFLDRHPLECLHRVQEKSLCKLLLLGNRSVLVRVEKISGSLRVRPMNTELTQAELVKLGDHVNVLFDLRRDLKPFYEHMNGDPIMDALIRDFFGLRLMGIPELFETLCWCIIGQQINLAFAYQLKRRLVHNKGEKLILNGEDYYLFPAPEIIADMRQEEFSEWQFSSAKASYLIGAAQKVCQGNLDKESLLLMSPDEALSTLTQLKGVGPWTAQYVMMKCLRIPTAYPIGDVGLHNAVKTRLGLTRKPTLPELNALNEQWHPWQAYATFYLWHSLLK